jgi:hypothetical protein
MILVVDVLSMWFGVGIGDDLVIDVVLLLWV